MAKDKLIRTRQRLLPPENDHSYRRRLVECAKDKGSLITVYALCESQGSELDYFGGHLALPRYGGPIMVRGDYG